MADILNKLNTLVRASIHGVADDLSPGKRRRPLTVDHLGRDIDHEIAALRDEVDRSLDEQDRREQEIRTNRDQIAAWDRQADEALQRGDEMAARRLIRQIGQRQRETAFLEAELDEHRRSLSELISRVNELEALVAEVRRREQAPDQPAASPEAAVDEVSTVDETDDLSLAARLRQARETVRTQEMQAVHEQPRPTDHDDERAVEDDLARRRARLS